MMILKKVDYILKETILAIKSKGNGMSDGAHGSEA